MRDFVIFRCFFDDFARVEEILLRLDMFPLPPADKVQFLPRIHRNFLAQDVLQTAPALSKINFKKKKKNVVYVAPLASGSSPFGVLTVVRGLPVTCLFVCSMNVGFVRSGGGLGPEGAGLGGGS